MIEAYMDESGIHEGAHVCVIAGYWGSQKKWKRFETRWREILRDANEPALKECRLENQKAESPHYYCQNNSLDIIPGQDSNHLKALAL